MELEFFSLVSTQLNQVIKNIDLNLVLFYTFLTTIFSIMLTFERSRKYINKLKLNKLKTAAQVAVRSSSKTASITKRKLYNVFLKTHNNTVKVRRIGGKFVRTIIKPLSYKSNQQQRNDNTAISTKAGTLLSSTMRRSSSYLLNKTSKLRLNILGKRIKLRASHKIYNSQV